MRRLVWVAVLLCFTAATPAQVAPALALFPIVVRFIGHLLHITPSTPAGQPSVQETPGIVIEIPDATVHKAQQLCQNWTWAASVETLLAPTGVALTQDDMVTRAEGGSVCKDRNPNFEQMTRVLDGSYYLEDGHKVKIETRNVTGVPTVIDDILMSMKKQHPLILFWKGHAYLLKGVVYSEFLISSNGAKVFEINELKLLDPTATRAEEREVSFVRDRDDASEIDGVMDVRVTSDDGQSWLNPDTEYQKNHQSPAERPMAPMPPSPPSIHP